MSDPEVPEYAGRSAFAELAEVVRNVSEQLAGYRRRALSAEAQVRELERDLERERVTLDSLRSRAGRVTDLEAALAQARLEGAQRLAALEQAQRSLDEARLELSGDSQHGAAQQLPDRAELALLNTALRERLDEATTRTGQIVERVRFLRQQLSNGGAA